jgi:hypothetical protein
MEMTNSCNPKPKKCSCEECWTTEANVFVSVAVMARNSSAPGQLTLLPGGRWTGGYTSSNLGLPAEYFGKS